MATVQLPLDVLDLVLASLQNDKPSLIQCCLVSRTFHRSSLRHLFAEISIHHVERSSQWKYLHDLFIANKRYLSWIRSIDVENVWYMHKDAPVDKGFAGFLELLASGASPHLISFSVFVYVPVPLKWSDIPVTLTEPIRRLCHAPHLRTLRIHIENTCSCAFPLQLAIYCASTVNHISLECGRWCTAAALGHPKPFDDVALEDLQMASRPLASLHILGSCSGFLEFFNSHQSPFLMENLNELVIGQKNHMNDEGTWKLVSNTVKSLETLVWFHPEVQCQTRLKPVKLAHSEYLTTLIISAVIPSADLRTFELLAIQNMLTAELSFPPSLRHLTVAISHSLHPYLEKILLPILEREQGICRLTIYLIIRRLDRGEAWIVEEPAEALGKKCFPGLDATGRLSVVIGKLNDLHWQDSVIALAH